MTDDTPNRVVIGISGASAAAYATRVIELLTEADVEVHVALSSLGRRLLFDELDIKRPDGDALSGGRGQRVTRAGAIIAPLAPGFYMRPQTIEDLVDFMAGRLLDLVQVPHTLAVRWGE